MRTKHNLVTLKDAKAHLNVDHDIDDGLINKMRARASGSVMDYCKVDVNDTSFDWTDAFGEPDNVPWPAEAATLIVLGAMYENRDGDAWRSPQPLSQAVLDLLHRLRDPAMA